MYICTCVCVNRGGAVEQREGKEGKEGEEGSHTGTGQCRFYTEKKISK